MTTRAIVAAFLVLAVCTASLPALAAPEGLSGGVLSDLPKLKDFKAGRQSSYDPTGGNNDGRQDWPIKPGETRQIAKIEGAGAITHIWTTIATADRNHLKNIVLRMYWDGEETPSVEAPIGDFFGQGHGKYYQFSSLPIQIGTNNGLNCFWRMPFGKGAVVTVTNDGPSPINAFYYYVDYQQYASLPDDVGRFHAQYRQTYPCVPNQNYVFLEATGRGHYVGCNLSIHNRADGWWGEGDDMIYIDGEEKPTFNGTGSEDYFCGAWCYGPAFSNPYFGCPLRGEHKRNSLWNVYRFHLEDPIPFTKSIRVTIEHGNQNDRSDDYSSVAYWYQTEPHAPFPPLPAPADRLPKDAVIFLEKDALEAEDLDRAIESKEVSVQAMGSYGKWSNDNQLWFRPKAPTNYAIPVPPAGTDDAGKFNLELWYTGAPDYGTCELWLNGEKVAAWDGYAPSVVRKKIEAPITVKEGENQLELRVTGKNETSKGFMAGLDCFRLAPTQ